MNRDYLLFGIKSMLPVIPGIIPFGIIMGSVATAQGLSIVDTMLMNSIVFAGASQLMVIDLISVNTPVIVIIFAGLTINLRFLLYSAANSETFKDCSGPVKVAAAYLLTDQSYAVVSANISEIDSIPNKIVFYFGASICMLLFWNSSVLVGCFFGNIVPTSFSLDFAVPLSFMALVVPTLKTRKHVAIAFLSATLSIVLFNLPLKLGLITTAFISIGIAYLLLLKEKRKKDAI